MMRWTSDGGKPFIEAELSGRYGIYLDNDSLIELSKGDADRRRRFVTQIRQKGGLLFSLTNAAELAGPQGASAAAVRDFLDSLGAFWVPLELNPYKIVKKEQAGVPSVRAPVSEEFMRAYGDRRLFDLSSEGNTVLDLSESFFRLSSVLDWEQEERESATEPNEDANSSVDAAAEGNVSEDAVEGRTDPEKLDDMLKTKVLDLRSLYEANAASLDRLLPPVQYDPRRPATFALIHLLRTLVTEAKAFQLKKGDGLDLCHAVVAAAYSSLGTLDKQWKRRVDNLPKPNGLARIFYRPQMDELVAALEGLPSKEGL